MKLVHIDTVNLPEYAVCAIEYGDYSGLDEVDEKEITSFLDDYNAYDGLVFE